MRSETDQIKALLDAVLARARAEGFAVRESLQFALWLIFRLLEKDFRAAEAYLALAYLFCLMQDWVRACQVLLHAEQLLPGHTGISQMLTKIRFTLQDPVPAAAPAGSRAQPANVALPPLDELRQRLEARLANGLAPAERYPALRPVLNSLARKIWEEP